MNSRQQTLAARVPDVKALKLSKNLETKIGQYVYQERMHWELWIESADSFAALRESLKKRGYKNLPFSSAPLFCEELGKIVKHVDEIKKVNLTLDSPAVKTMLRKI